MLFATLPWFECFSQVEWSLCRRGPRKCAHHHTRFSLVFRLLTNFALRADPPQPQTRCPVPLENFVLRSTRTDRLAVAGVEESEGREGGSAWQRPRQDGIIVGM